MKVILALSAAILVVAGWLSWHKRVQARWLECRCGHAMIIHEHYRPGTDCGYCGKNGCPYFRNVAK